LQKREYHSSGQPIWIKVLGLLRYAVTPNSSAERISPTKANEDVKLQVEGNSKSRLLRTGSKRGAFDCGRCLCPSVTAAASICLCDVMWDGLGVKDETRCQSRLRSKLDMENVVSISEKYERSEKAPSAKGDPNQPGSS
jgi:hypothetical protein